MQKLVSFSLFFVEMSKVVAVVGMCGSGKSEVIGRILATYRFEKVYFGGIVLEEVARRGFPLMEIYERPVREDLRAQHGQSAIAVVAFPKIQELLALGHDVLIDGMYSFSEYTFLKSRLGADLSVIAVHAPKKLRYERLAVRDHRPMTQEEVDARDYTEITYIEKSGPIAIADRHIINDASREILCERVDLIMQRVEGVVSKS